MTHYKQARGVGRKLLKVIYELQHHIGKAKGYHDNDRDPHGFEKGQRELEAAFKLCIDTTGQYEYIDS